MIKDISALEIKYILTELKTLIDGKIDKVYQPNASEVILQVHVSGSGKKLLKIVNGKYLCLSESKSSSLQPKGFCMALRKYLSGARIRDIKQIGFERIVEIQFETKEGSFNLFLEFFDKGNMILVKDNVIIAVLQHQKWKERDLKPKEEYKYPSKKYDTTEIYEKLMEEILSNSTQEKVVKTLAIDLGLGGVYAEEVCLLANVDKNEKPAVEFAKKLTEELKKIMNKKINTIAYYKDDKLKNVVPFALKQYEELEKKEFKSFSSAIDKLIIAENKEKTTSYDKEIQKLEKMISQQEKQIMEMEEKAVESTKKGELIYEKYQLVEEIIKDLKEAKKKFSLKEMRTKLKDHKIVKGISEKGEILIEI